MKKSEGDAEGNERAIAMDRLWLLVRVSAMDRLVFDQHDADGRDGEGDEGQKQQAGGGPRRRPAQPPTAGENIMPSVKPQKTVVKTRRTSWPLLTSAVT